MDENTQAAKIRRQVEHYFSDENLPNDRFLLAKTGGTENKPVSLSIIHGFKKMRGYQPYAMVVAALRASELLVIEGETGKETVKRMNPLAAEIDSETGEVIKTKKKKKKKSAGKKARGNGFEEGFCEAPVTPAEYDEECDIYHQSRSFIERIEQCIQRYRARRNMDSSRSHIFNTYLLYGGIETGVKAFGGGALDNDALEDLNSNQIRAIAATDTVGKGDGTNRKFFHPDNFQHWTVDFEGVVKGFLSSIAPRVFGTDSDEIIKSYCMMIQNFLNYVLTHSVCPEYTKEILEARRICTLAQNELCAIRRLSVDFPGDYNKSASTLFSGRTPFAGNLADETRIFHIAVALAAEEDQYHAMIACNNKPKTIKSERRDFEIIEIIFPSKETKELYASTTNLNGTTNPLKALGRIKVIPWTNPDHQPEDITRAEEAQKALHQARANLALKTQNLAPSKFEALMMNDTNIQADKAIYLHMEESILEHAFVGMKLGCTLHTLDIGMQYFDDVTGIYTSFHTYLLTEMLAGWKEPCPSERPAPRADGVDGDGGGFEEGDNGDDAGGFD